MKSFCPLPWGKFFRAFVLLSLIAVALITPGLAHAFGGAPPALKSHAQPIYFDRTLDTRTANIILDDLALLDSMGAIRLKPSSHALSRTQRVRIFGTDTPTFAELKTWLTSRVRAFVGKDYSIFHNGLVLEINGEIPVGESGAQIQRRFMQNYGQRLGSKRLRELRELEEARRKRPMQVKRPANVSPAGSAKTAARMAAERAAERAMVALSANVFASGRSSDEDSAPLVYGLILKPHRPEKNIPATPLDVVLPITSPREGVVAVYPALLDPSKELNAGGLLQPQARLKRLSYYFHEARHSDGLDEDIGLSHTLCPSDHALDGEFACDLTLNGPYSITALMLEAFSENCPKCSHATVRELSESHRSILQRVLVDSKTRQDPNRFLAPSFWPADDAEVLPLTHPLQQILAAIKYKPRP